MEIIAETDSSLRLVENYDLWSLPVSEPAPDHATYVAEHERRRAFDVKCRDNFDQYLKSHEPAIQNAESLKEEPA